MVPKHSLYSASKGAIESFVPCLAVDCGKKRITVNAIAPGGIVTDMFHATAKDYLPHSENMSEEQIMKVSFVPIKTKWFSLANQQFVGRSWHRSRPSTALASPWMSRVVLFSLQATRANGSTARSCGRMVGLEVSPVVRTESKLSHVTARYFP